MFTRSTKLEVVVFSDKKILNDMYYITGIKRNIVSLGQATEVGCEVRMKDNILMLFDRSGHLLIKTTRSRNRLYKVTLQTYTIQCLQIASSTESSASANTSIGFAIGKAELAKSIIETEAKSTVLITIAFVTLPDTFFIVAAIPFISIFKPFNIASIP